MPGGTSSSSVAMASGSCGTPQCAAERRPTGTDATSPGDAASTPRRGAPAGGVWSGTSWRILRSLHRWCSSSMLLCRRWWTQCWSFSVLWTCRLTSRSSQCPGSPLTVSRSVWWSGVSLRWWNSWLHVPTVLSPLRIAEQIVGIPAPQRGGDWSLQGPLPGQSSTLSPLSKRISGRIVEQIVDISPSDDRGQGSSSSAGLADEDFPGFFFALSLMEKSAECRAGQCGPAPARQLIHAGGSARAGPVVRVTHACFAG